jgi:hypothetical protein
MPQGQHCASKFSEHSLSDAYTSTRDPKIIAIHIESKVAGLLGCGVYVLTGPWR